jgi:hypothetical protein
MSEYKDSVKCKRCGEAVAYCTCDPFEYDDEVSGFCPECSAEILADGTCNHYNVCSLKSE